MRLPETGSLLLAKRWEVNVHLLHDWRVLKIGTWRYMHHEWTLN